MNEPVGTVKKVVKQSRKIETAPMEAMVSPISQEIKTRKGRFEKGSDLARAHMAKLRSMRGKNKETVV